MKITVRCGVSDGGKPCGNELGAIPREDLDFAHGVFTFERLRWEERHYECDKHGPVQVHDEDLLRRALNPRRPVIMARRAVDRSAQRNSSNRQLKTSSGEMLGNPVGTRCTAGQEVATVSVVHGELLGEPSAELSEKLAGSQVPVLFTPYQSM